MPTPARAPYPNSYADLRIWFDEEWKCLDYLDWLRWPNGFMCPACAHDRGWRAPDQRWRCAGCGKRVSALAGTIFHGTRTSLAVWFSAAWLLVNSKAGLSATQLHRETELGSLQTAWAMLHRYRSVMVQPGRERLRGNVEVDVSYLGGSVPGRGSLSRVLFAVAVEVDAGGLGRTRVAVIPSAGTAQLAAFVLDSVEPGSRVVTHDWSAYPSGVRDRYAHVARPAPAPGSPARQVAPAVRRVIFQANHWLMGPRQGAVSAEHLPAYVDEWVFRFNHRYSDSRGQLFHTLLGYAVAGRPVTYQSLLKSGRSQRADETGSTAPALEAPTLALPWR